MSIENNAGFSMIEVMVTVAITTVGLLGISSLQLQSNRAMQDSGNRSQAVWILEDLTNRINANSSALASYDTGGNYQCAVPSTICADYYNGGKQSAAMCTPQQTAVFDLWDVACPKTYVNSSNTDIKESYADFISKPVLKISTDIANNKATLTITWDVRTAGQDSNGNKLYTLSDDQSNNLRTDSLTRQIQL